MPSESEMVGRVQPLQPRRVGGCKECVVLQYLEITKHPNTCSLCISFFRSLLHCAATLMILYVPMCIWREQDSLADH